MNILQRREASDAEASIHYIEYTLEDKPTYRRAIRKEEMQLALIQPASTDVRSQTVGGVIGGSLIARPCLLVTRGIAQC